MVEGWGAELPGGGMWTRLSGPRVCRLRGQKKRQSGRGPWVSLEKARLQGQQHSCRGEQVRAQAWQGGTAAGVWWPTVPSLLTSPQHVQSVQETCPESESMNTFIGHHCSPRAS